MRRYSVLALQFRLQQGPTQLHSWPHCLPRWLPSTSHSNLVAANINQMVSSSEGANSQALVMELRALNNNLQAHRQSVETHTHSVLGSMRALTEVMQAQAGAFRALHSRLAGLIEDDSCNRQVSQLARSVLNMEEPRRTHHRPNYSYRGKHK